MSNEKVNYLAKEIFEHVGGKMNVQKIMYCITRVRLTIIDYEQVDIVGLKAIDGVLGVIEDDSLQVVLGPGIVGKVAQKMADMAHVKLGEVIVIEDDFAGQSGRQKVESKAAEVKAKQKAKNDTKFKNILKSIANIFVPLIPAFVGAGLIGGVAAIFQNMMTAGTISGEEWVTIVTTLNIIKNGIFSYLVIYVGINAATEFNATPALGGVIGGTVMLTGMNVEEPLKNLFTGQGLAAGQGGVIGVIFAVWLLSLIEKYLHKVVPDSIDIIVTPTVALLVTGLLTIFIIMPIAGVISDSLVGAIQWVVNVGGAFSGFILGALFLPLVMFGLHQVLTPIHFEMINQTGSTLLLPILAMAGAGQVGAAFALWLRAKKDSELATMIKGALPVGILGIGEPLIYGVTLPLGKPFVTACIGGGIGGAVIGAIGNIGAITVGPSGVALIPLIAEGRWWGYAIGLLAGYIGGFVLTLFFGIPKDILED